MACNDVETNVDCIGSQDAPIPIGKLKEYIGDANAESISLKYSKSADFFFIRNFKVFMHFPTQMSLFNDHFSDRVCNIIREWAINFDVLKRNISWCFNTVTRETRNMLYNMCYNTEKVLESLVKDHGQREGLREKLGITTAEKGMCFLHSVDGEEWEDMKEMMYRKSKLELLRYFSHAHSSTSMDPPGPELQPELQWNGMMERMSSLLKFVDKQQQDEKRLRTITMLDKVISVRNNAESTFSECKELSSLVDVESQLPESQCEEILKQEKAMNDFLNRLGNSAMYGPLT
jgi:hypothetical protein